MSTSQSAPLAGVRVIESSMLGPAGITTHLADLGADVIKIEPPQGDYIREMTWPIIEGTSLMHLHLNRGKKSVALNLKNPEGVQIYKDLVATADCVVEAMRPGSLARLGLGFDDLKQINPKIVFCNISGYGMTGPYKSLPAHGIAFDTWAGIIRPAYDEDGYCYIPEHASIGIHAGPIFGAFGILAAIIRARDTGEAAFLEIGQSDAAAYMDWYRSESHMAYRRPEDVVTGNKSDNYERRAVGTAGMKEGVRYQMYDASDGVVMIMCSEQAFWKNFCEACGRQDLFEKWPGSKYADHARNNRELQAELKKIFVTKTCQEWIDLGNEKNFPMAPVNTPENIVDDPQFKDRFDIYPHEKHGADMLPFPVQFVNESLPAPTKAPTVGEHSAKVLADVLGYDAAKVEELKGKGAFGG
jgi:crotonobetainyl-CoA:carnitine CoA-transferase CaiB-like acyl-CoA transferase